MPFKEEPIKGLAGLFLDIHTVDALGEYSYMKNLQVTISKLLSN